MHAFYFHILTTMHGQNHIKVGIIYQLPGIEAEENSVDFCTIEFLCMYLFIYFYLSPPPKALNPSAGIGLVRCSLLNLLMFVF